MTAEQFYNELEIKPDFTQLTKTGISSNLLNVLNFAEDYANHVLEDRITKDINTAIKALECFGKEPKLDIERKCISFSSFGFEAFTELEKDIIRNILGENLSEFYYAGHDTQEIYIKSLPEPKK